MFEVGVRGPPFISNGSSFDAEFGFPSINGEAKLLLVFNFDDRGDGTEAFWEPRWDGGPWEWWVGVVEPAGGLPVDNGLAILFGVEVDRVDGVMGSSLQDDDEEEDDGNGWPAVLVPLFAR